MQERVMSERVSRPAWSYSHAIRAGDLVFISGQGPLDSDGQVVGDSVEEQTARTLDNVAAIAEAAGGSLRNVVRVGAYLASLDDFAAYNEVYSRYFDFDPKPARTTIGAGLLDILVEIDAVLYLPSR